MKKSKRKTKKAPNASMVAFKKKIVKVKMPKNVDPENWDMNKEVLEKVHDVYREAAEKEDNDDSDDENGAGANKIILMPIDEEASDESEVDEEDLLLKKMQLEHKLK